MVGAVRGVLRGGIGVAFLGQPLCFCLRGQAFQLTEYPISFGFYCNVLMTPLAYVIVQRFTLSFCLNTVSYTHLTLPTICSV